MATLIPDPIPGLLDALELLDDSIALVHVAMNQNPSADEERRLNQQELRLQAERGVLEAEINSSVAGQPAQGPTPTQHAEIARLSSQVEAATQANVAASAAIALVSDALGLVTQIVST